MPERRGPTARARALLRWFARHRRALPWRRDRAPYLIWVAEVLLQQTRVAQAVPFFERFVRRFPSVEALARAPLSEVLRVWAGAGYYARARHLHAAARRLVRERAGELPRTVPELEALPGVGPYIARAVASLAFGVPVVALEANGLRVAARWSLDEGDVRTPRVRARLAAVLAADLATGTPGPYNEAIMELGETVCLPRRPRCDVCPVAFACRARRELPDPAVLPRPGARPRRPHVRGAVVVLSEAATGRWLVQRRAADDLLGGLWEFPGGKIEPGERPRDAARRELREETGFAVPTLEFVGTVRHGYSHFTVELHVFRGTHAGPAGRLPPGRRWVAPERIPRLPLPKATEKILRLLTPGRASPDSGSRPDRTGASRSAASRPRPVRARGRRTPASGGRSRARR